MSRWTGVLRDGIGRSGFVVERFRVRRLGNAKRIKSARIDVCATDELHHNAAISGSHGTFYRRRDGVARKI